jgi:Methyltransferase domain
MIDIVETQVVDEVELRLFGAAMIVCRRTFPDNHRTSAPEYAAWLSTLDGAGLHTGAVVLDLGCGCGVPMSRDLVQLGHQVTGVDLSGYQIERARRAAAPSQRVADRFSSVCSRIAVITCSPVPTARANKPSRISPANSPSATLTVSGTAGWLVSISWFCSPCARRSPSSWCSWRFTRVPTAQQGSGGGPPPQVPRDPGQPPRSAREGADDLAPEQRLAGCFLRLGVASSRGIGRACG